MSESESNKSVSSALLSIASAYSDSESSEETGEDSTKPTRRTLGGFVESLRAKEQNSKDLPVSENSTVQVKPEDHESEKSITKIVRLDSGKVVKISTSPTKPEGQVNESKPIEPKDEIDTQSNTESALNEQDPKSDNTEEVVISASDESMGSILSHPEAENVIEDTVQSADKSAVKKAGDVKLPKEVEMSKSEATLGGITEIQNDVGGTTEIRSAVVETIVLGTDAVKTDVVETVAVETPKIVAAAVQTVPVDTSELKPALIERVDSKVKKMETDEVQTMSSETDATKTAIKEIAVLKSAIEKTVETETTMVKIAEAKPEILESSEDKVQIAAGTCKEESEQSAPDMGIPEIEASRIRMDENKAGEIAIQAVENKQIAQKAAEIGMVNVETSEEATVAVENVTVEIAEIAVADLRVENVDILKQKIPKINTSELKTIDVKPTEVETVISKGDEVIAKMQPEESVFQKESVEVKHTSIKSHEDENQDSPVSPASGDLLKKTLSEPHQPKTKASVDITRSDKLLSNKELNFQGTESHSAAVPKTENVSKKQSKKESIQTIKSPSGSNVTTKPPTTEVVKKTNRPLLDRQQPSKQADEPEIIEIIPTTVESKTGERRPDKIILDRSILRKAEPQADLGVKSRPSEMKPLPKLERIKIRPTGVAKVVDSSKKVEPFTMQATSSILSRKLEESSSAGHIQSPPEKKPSGSGPIKLKRNFGDSGNSDFLVKKFRSEQTTKATELPNILSRPKPQFSSSEEIREILAKRLGTGLDISIIPAKPKVDPSVTIGELEIIARSHEHKQPQQMRSPPQQMRSPPQQIRSPPRQLKSPPQQIKSPPQQMKSPPRVMIPTSPSPRSKISPLPGPKTLTSPSAYQQKLVQAQQNYQASFASMISSSQGRFPVQSQRKSPQHPQPVRISGKDTPGISIQSSQVPKKTQPTEGKKTIPLIIRKADPEGRKAEIVKDAGNISGKKDDSNEIQVIKIKKDDITHNVEVKKVLGQTEMSTDSSCSSGSELQSSTIPFDSSSSSQDQTHFAEEGIDFENIIGSSVVCKDTGLPPRPENLGGDNGNLPANLETPKIQQPTVVLQNIEVVTPKKRGRPRKSTQIVNNPTPVMSAWPDVVEEFPDGKTEKQLGRAERRRRREAAKISYIKPKVEAKAEVKEVQETKEVKEVKEEVEVVVLKDESEEDSKEDSKKKEDEDRDSETAEEEEPPKKQRFIPKPPLKKKRRRGAYSVKRRTATPRKEKEKKNAEKENVQNFEEETRMSASEVPQTMSTKTGPPGDESQGSSVTTETQASRNVNKKGRIEVMTEHCKPITVQQITEYYWPPLSTLPHGEKGEGLMIQEQISEYLGVKSFKRKYPRIKRRPVDMEERNYLQENGFVSENMCDMGLTAVFAADIIEIMFNDFPNKFEEFRKYTREKKAKEQKALREKQAAERADMDPRKEALEATLSWNTDFNKARTFTIIHPFSSKRFETEGTPVPPFEKVVILHATLGCALCVETNFWKDTIFSPECDVSIRSSFDRWKQFTAPNLWKIMIGQSS